MSTLPVNSARGEVALRIGTVDLVIAAEISRLAAVSTALECKSFVDLIVRLGGAELAAVHACIRHLPVRGDVSAALAAFTLSDVPVCKEAISAALAHHFRDADTGKAEAAGEGAAA